MIRKQTTPKLSGLPGLTAVLLLMVPVAVVAQEEADEAVGMLIEASIEYQYGDQNQGAVDLDSKIGMVAPGIRILLPGQKLGIAFRYLSGDFDGSQTVPIPDGSIAPPEISYGSRKEMTLSQSREDVQLQALYRPFGWITLSSGYQYLELQTECMLDLVSDVRTYGSGTEFYGSKARGVMLGTEFYIPLFSSWTLQLVGQATPWLDTTVTSNYLYMLPLEESALGEEWVHNGKAEGYLGSAALQFLFPSQNVALKLGYVYQEVRSTDDVSPTWVDLRLGQEARDWRTNRYQGFSGSVVFYF
jgi:hypothetical protein